MSQSGCVVLADALTKMIKQKTDLLEAVKLSKEILEILLPVTPGNNEPVVRFIKTLEELIKLSSD